MHAFILKIIAGGGYWGLFALMALENVFPPIPSEIIMGYTGVLVAKGGMQFWPALVVGTGGTVAGNFFWYWLGRRWDERHLERFVTRNGRWLTMDWGEFTAARTKFRRHGDWIVLFLRVSPMLRTMISLPAGLARMRAWRFALFTFLGSLVWNGVLLAGGKELAPLIDRYQALASVAVGGFLVVGLFWYVWRVWRWRPAETRD